MKRLLILIVLGFMPFFAMSQYSENDWKERDTWMNVNKIFNLANITSGNHVADIGCHEGYLSVHLANRVGETGEIYAVDVREDRLESLKENLKARNLTNVNVIHGDYDNPKLPTNSLDVVFIMDTYHEIDDYMTILKHVHAALKPDGRIVIMEKLKKRVRNGTRNEQTEAHSLSPKYVKKDLIKAGFKITNQLDAMGDWENDSDKVMWMVIGVKPKLSN